MAANLSYSGWSADTLAPIALRDTRLASRTPTQYSNAGTRPTNIPDVVANATNNVLSNSLGGYGVTPLQTQLMALLSNPEGYLAAPTLTASAVQPGAMFSFSSNSAYQNPLIGKGYHDVAQSVAGAQNRATHYAGEAMKRARDTNDAYYNYLNNYLPGGSGGAGDRLNTLYNLQSTVNRNTNALLNTKATTPAMGWGGVNIPGL